MDGFTLQPAAGTWEMVGNDYQSLPFKCGTKPEPNIGTRLAHGTNPATANMIGFDVIEVKSITGD